MTDHLLYGVQRTGMYGKHEKIKDVLEPLFEGKPDGVVTEMLGPTASDINKFMKYQQVPFPGANLIRPIATDLRANERRREKEEARKAAAMQNEW
jgi:hypothetical protein